MMNMKDFNSRSNYANHLLLERKLFEMETAIDEVMTHEHCGNCGALINDWDDVEYTDKEVIMTHKCACGRYAEVHYKLVFDKINVIEEGELQ